MTTKMISPGLIFFGRCVENRPNEPIIQKMSTGDEGVKRSEKDVPVRLGVPSQESMEGGRMSLQSVGVFCVCLVL